MIKWPIGAEFDPDETKDYTADWTQEMDARADTLTSSTFTVNTATYGLTIQASAIAAGNKKTIVWFIADDKPKLLTFAGTSVPIEHTVTTSGGRTLNRTLGLKIKER